MSAPISLNLLKMKKGAVAAVPAIFMLFSHFYNQSSISALDARITALEQPSPVQKAVNIIDDLESAFQHKPLQPHHPTSPLPHLAPKGAS